MIPFGHVHPVICKALEASKNAVEGRICGLQTEVIETNRGGGGVDGSGGSEALQKELLLILTDLAKASAEVPTYPMPLDRRREPVTGLVFL